MPTMRFVLQGLLAATLYSGYWYFSYTPPATSLTLSPDHTTSSLTTGPALPDGRAPLSRRTVAVADLHGDLSHALNVLSMASVITTSPPTWVGGHDVLVSTGDIVDRGDDTIPLYRLFISLREQARAAGGEVKNCLGNHEIMNALGDWRYVTPGDVKSFGGVEERRKAMSSQGWIGKDWLEAYNVTHTISLLPAQHPALPAGYTPPKINFVHGGITPEYAASGVDYINTVGKSFLEKALSNTHPSYLPPNTTQDEQDLWSEHGPLWYRGYATDSPTQACANAALATESLSVKHLVMGHTPHFDGFVTRCNNSILLIDTGISKAYGGEQSALIIDFQLHPVEGEQKAWVEKTTLTALYRGRRPKVISNSEERIEL